MPSKHLSQREDLKMLMDLTFRRKILICIAELLKVLLHPPPPLERESLFKVVGLMIQKMAVLSIEK